MKMDVSSELKRQELIKLIYEKQRKKTVTKAQIKRVLELMIKVANELS